MTIIKTFASGMLATWLVVACVAEPEPIDPSSRSLAPDKIEIDPKGKVTCKDGTNTDCFAADKEHCKEGDYTGACRCTHCEGGNICEKEADHTAHDEQCKLKPAEAEAELGLELAVEGN